MVFPVSALESHDDLLFGSRGYADPAEGAAPASRAGTS